ncbi:GAF domain-containing protein [Paenibacillus yonginensis]|uniref:GAF domain-containing protein n=1 Tax=Paenibacillus yonginensis TaxID=1462996 RepID=A0A1B1N646_9BACL|nr:GAF domain-containing protein [Paenibacillus yonginensis]ANS76903.1 GAF domain-containing protein [Paenibacillus yonginensis]
MFQAATPTGDRQQVYESALTQLKGLIEGEPNSVANLANASALLNFVMQDINWAGFYLYDGKELVLGPFQGLPACIRIPLGRGVCGTSAQQRETIVVEDVHAFAGHIACDSATNSEIVVPIVQDGRLIGVLDIDSPLRGRFDETDKTFLEAFVEILVSSVKFS